MTKRQDLTIRQGETWSFAYTHMDSAGAAVDLSGYTARMSIKAAYEGTTEAYLSTGADADGGTIELGGSAGTVTLAMTAAQSANLAGDLSYLIFPGEPSKAAERAVEFRYDLEIVSGAGAVTRVLEGRVKVLREVTS